MLGKHRNEERCHLFADAQTLQHYNFVDFCSEQVKKLRTTQSDESSTP